MMDQTEAEAESPNELDSSEQSSSGEKSEEAQLVEYAGKALRGRRFGIFEQILCQSLVQATVTYDPLRKIQLVCESAMMLDPDKQEALRIDLLKLEVIRVITEGFSNRVEEKGKDNYCLVDVRFGFDESEENYSKYIAPWRKEDERLIHYSYRLAQLYRRLGTSYRRFICIHCRTFLFDDLHDEEPNVNKEKGTCAVCGSEIHGASNYDGPSYAVQVSFKFNDSTPIWKREFTLFHCLAKAGYNKLKSSFLQWSLPFVMNITRKLTEAVRPEIYREIAEMFVKARKEETPAVNNT